MPVCFCPGNRQRGRPSPSTDVSYFRFQVSSAHPLSLSLPSSPTSIDRSITMFTAAPSHSAGSERGSGRGKEGAPCCSRATAAGALVIILPVVCSPYSVAVQPKCYCCCYITIRPSVRPILMDVLCSALLAIKKSSHEARDGLSR